MPATYLRNGITSPHAQETEAAMKAREGDGKDILDSLPLKPGVIPQTASRVEALFRAVHRMSELGLNIHRGQVLDVGAGAGYGLKPFLMAGFPLSSLHGIDLFQDRVDLGLKLLPGIELVHGDATKLWKHWPPSFFDVTCEQFCFCHIPSRDVQQQIAREMVFVTKPGRFILIHDWRMSSETRHISGMTQTLIRQMFQVGTSTREIGRYPSQLWPPIGRRVPGSVYDLLRAVPPLVGSRITLLQRLETDR